MHSRHAIRRFEGPSFGAPARGGPFGSPARGGPFGPGGEAQFARGGGGSFGRGGRYGGPPGGGRGRRRRGEIRTALMLLLAEEPRNGYQLMQAIEERSGGRWRPSPGSIYPTLAQLEDEGLIRATEEEVGKLFELTERGREHIQERQDRTPPWEDSDEPEAAGDLRTQVKQLHVAVMQVGYAGRNDQIARAAKALAEARRAIYGILAEEADD
jgi:DNA-binding PadR family transcriptional regulator